MLATFVIGLREGLEAALIVGIIAAFLKQNDRRDALRKMWFGVGVAVLLCLGVGLLLQAINSNLPQRQQEMLECVVAAVAVVMVSYMVLWMKAHSRSLKSDLHQAAGSALAAGSATALVVMAFLAVFREGFETAVFLLAAFQSAVSPAQAVTGAVLGVVIAVGLGYLIYRGGVRLNLSKFFRITGVVLVLVAAGLVMSTFRAAYEAGWLTIGQQHAVSLSLIARPGTVQESLLTGVLGIRSSMPVIEIVAYLLYLIPMLAVVLWPARRALSGRRLGQVLVGSAAAALAIAVLLFALAPSVPATAATALQVRTVAVAGTDPATGAPQPTTATPGQVTAQLSAGNTAVVLTGAVAGQSDLRLSGHTKLAGVDAAQYTGATVTGPITDTGLPATLTAKQVAALNSTGRLPVGIASSSGVTGPLTAAYAQSWTPVVTIDPATGTVLDLQVTTTRSVTVKTATGVTAPVGAFTELQLTTDPASTTAALAAAADVTDRRANHEVLGEVVPGLLTLFALILLAFGLPHLLRRTKRPTAPTPPTATHESLYPVAAPGRSG